MAALLIRAWISAIFGVDLLVISPCARRYDTWTSYAISLSSDSVAREAAPSSLGVGCDGYLDNDHCAIPRCFVHSSRAAHSLGKA
jgi:hypothetical protein